MRSFSSRLQSTYEKRNRQKIVIFITLSVIVLIFLIKAGIPAIFSISQAISQVRRNSANISQADNSVIPTIPIFSQDLTATSSANVKISGASDPKITIEVTQNGRSLGTAVAKDDGSFSYDVSLEKNENTFIAIAISESGKKSPQSQAYVIRFLSGQPKLDIISPKDGDKISQNQTNISGKIDSGNTVTVNDRFAIVNSDGSFSYTLNLASGENKIKVTVTDPAGNKTSKEFTVTKG